MMRRLTASWPSHLVTVLVYSYSVQGLGRGYRGVGGREDWEEGKEGNCDKDGKRMNE